MAKPVYRLAVLLRLKAREKRMAEIALARAITALREAEEREKKLKEEKVALQEEWQQQRKEMDADMNQGGMVFDGNVHVNFLRKIKEDEEQKDEEIAEQQAKIEECKTKVSRRRREYIDASREHQVMEKHKELWTKKVKKDMSRAEEKEFDELCTTIHQLRGWRGDKGQDTHATAF
jgi:flagellar biosynthesis chaperone FliJ